MATSERGRNDKADRRHDNDGKGAGGKGARGRDGNGNRDARKGNKGGWKRSGKDERGDKRKKSRDRDEDGGKGGWSRSGERKRGADSKGDRAFARKDDRKRERTSRDGERKGPGKGFRKDKRDRHVDVKPVYEKADVIEPNAGVEDSEEAAGSRPRKWAPNREPRKVKSKKSFDQEKMQSIVEGTTTIYRGELDPREKDPDRRPRSISRSEELVMRKAEALAEAEAEIHGKRPKLATHTDFRSLYESCEASPGRLAALYATQQIRFRSAYAQEVIEASIDTAKISQEDRAFATLLTLGVTSCLGTVDDVLNRCLESPRDIKPDVRDAMRISAYEIIFLRKAPYAALDQGVELVRAVAPSASGLANAVLHRVVALSDDFPFGDPAKDIEALARLYAFPTWLATRLVSDLGAQPAAELMKASNEPAPLFVSVNSILARDEEVVDLLREAGADVEPAEAGGVAPAGCYRVSNSRVLVDGRVSRLFSQGKLLVSDAAAQAVAQCVVEDGLPASLLEVGAGRGTKTLLMQNISNRLYGDQVELTSMDSHGFKTDLLRERARTYGARINDLVTGNGARLDNVMGDRMFEEIFIDAPCSGLGTLRRHHEIRWRLGEEQIAELADLGLSLLKSAAGHVERSGRIVYSTCTVTYDENNGVVKRFLESEEGQRFALAPINGKACFTSQLSPGSPDAHFAAKFVRKM